MLTEYIPTVYDVAMFQFLQLRIWRCLNCCSLRFGDASIQRLQITDASLLATVLSLPFRGSRGPQYTYVFADLRLGRQEGQGDLGLGV